MWWIIGILSIPYGLKMLKDDYHSMRVDLKTTVIDSEESNKNNIKREFENICNAVGIKLDKNGRPVSKDQYTLGVQFLQYKGHSDETINVFYDMFMDRFNGKLIEEGKQIESRNNVIENSDDYNLMVFRHDYYGYMDSKDRFNKLNNQAWGKMVKDCRCIPGRHAYARYTEIWTLRVPIEFRRKDLKRLYKDSCISAEIDFGDFRGN